MPKTIIPFVIICMLLISCTPSETEDYREAKFNNLTDYRNYDNSIGWLVNVRAKYTAKVFNNEIQIADTNYVNNALYYHDRTDSNWYFIGDFGRDSLSVIFRDNDSAYVRSRDSLVYRVIFATKTLKQIGKTHSAFQDSIYTTIDAANVRRIDNLNFILNKYLTYPKWKEAIQKKYF